MSTRTPRSLPSTEFARSPRSYSSPAASSGGAWWVPSRSLVWSQSSIRRWRRCAQVPHGMKTRQVKEVSEVYGENVPVWAAVVVVLVIVATGIVAWAGVRSAARSLFGVRKAARVSSLFAAVMTAWLAAAFLITIVPRPETADAATGAAIVLGWNLALTAVGYGLRFVSGIYREVIDGIPQHLLLAFQSYRLVGAIFLPLLALVPSQRGLCEMGYSVPHETSHFCSGTVGKRARTARSRTALEGLLCDAPMPDTSGQRPRRVSPEDSRKSWMRLANGEERHPSLQRARSRRPRPRLLAPQARPCRFRREERRVLAGDAPPLAEGVRARFESLDIGDGRRGGLRGGADGRARLGGDHPGYLVAPPFREVDAGQAVDHLP